MTTKNSDYGININIASVFHSDDSIDFGITINDSDGFDYDCNYENITGRKSLEVITNKIFCEISEGLMASAIKRAAEQAEQEEKAYKMVVEKNNQKNDELAAMEDKIKHLEDQLESFKIDNEILRMRNDKLVNKFNSKPAPKIETKYDNKIPYGISKKPEVENTRPQTFQDMFDMFNVVMPPRHWF